MFGFFSATRKQRFATCSGDSYRRIYHDIVIDNGDLLHLDQRMERFEESPACMEYCPATFVRAVFQRSQEIRDVTDVFRLAYVDGQHNWFQEYLVVFDRPVDSVYGLYVEEEQVAQRATRINYLDEGLNIVESVDISSYQVTGD
jgi:hypothetical protein